MKRSFICWPMPRKVDLERQGPKCVLCPVPKLCAHVFSGMRAQLGVDTHAMPLETLNSDGSSCRFLQRQNKERRHSRKASSDVVAGSSSSSRPAKPTHSGKPDHHRNYVVDQFMESHAEGDSMVPRKGMDADATLSSLFVTPPKRRMDRMVEVSMFKLAVSCSPFPMVSLRYCPVIDTCVVFRSTAARASSRRSQESIGWLQTGVHVVCDAHATHQHRLRNSRRAARRS
jgi:hypothetical protein